MALITPLKLAQHKDRHDKEEIRKDEQEKQYRYYSGDFYNIKRLLVAALEITYSSEDVEEMQLELINITEKIINQMCVVYLEPAQRTIVVGGEISDELTDYYNSILPMDVNTADKFAHRIAKLHNTSLTHITFENGKFKYTILPSYLYDIKQDAKKLLEVSYEKMYDDEWYKVFWTDTKHYRMDAFMNKAQPVPGGDGTNPFKVMPFPVLRMKNCVDFWGEGQNDLINVNEQTNVLLTKLVNSDVIMGTEGTVLGINLELNKAGTEESGEKKVRTGRRHPITVNNVGTEMVQPSLNHVTSDPHIVDTQRMIDWYIRMISVFKGLNPNAVFGQIKDTSDFQKIMDASEQVEIRKDDVDPCRVYEQERFEITKTMNNTLLDTEEGLQEIPEDAELRVNFAEVEVQKTPQDLRDDRDWRLEKNLTTLIQILKDDDPDLTDDEAEQILEKNKESNSALVGKTSRFESLIKQNEGNLNE